VKELAVAKSKEVKTRSHLAESSKEGHGSKGAVWLMMIPMKLVSLVKLCLNKTY
jgi:hypothetical protein